MVDINPAWTFPSDWATSNASFPYVSWTNATTNSTVFGGTPIYVGDGVQLEWDHVYTSIVIFQCQLYSTDTHNTTHPHTYSRSFEARPGYTYTLPFLTSPSCTQDTTQNSTAQNITSQNSTHNSACPDIESCIFTLDSAATNNPHSIPFPLLSTRRPNGPLLFTSTHQQGIPFNASNNNTDTYIYTSYGSASSSSHKLAKILGSVFGVLGFLALGGLTALWWMRRKRRARMTTGRMESGRDVPDARGVEMERRMEGVGGGEIGREEVPPPSYKDAVKGSREVDEERKAEGYY